MNQQEYNKKYWLKNKHKYLENNRKNALEYRKNNLEKVREKQREHYHKNKKNISEKNKLKYNPEKQKEYILKNYNRVLLSAAKSRAIRKNLEFNLVIDDIIIPEICPVFGIKLDNSSGKHLDDSPSIDRIDNTKGYIKNNIVIISHKANRIKNNATIEELEKLIKFIKEQVESK